MSRGRDGMFVVVFRGDAGGGVWKGLMAVGA